MRKYKGCGSNGCGACCGGACSGCGGTLQLTQGEIDFLMCFAQIPFLPVARRSDSEQPIYLEDDAPAEGNVGEVILALRQKALIRLDYDMPLSNFDYESYRAYPHWGSMALTAEGQRVVEQLELLGIAE